VLWLGGWALAVTAGGAALLAVLGALTAPTAIALALGLAPGVLGFVWRPRGDRRLGLMAVWAVAMTLAATAGGGVTGPLVGWCATPLLLGALFRRLPHGAALSIGALLLSAGLQWAGAAQPAPAGAAGVMLWVVGLMLLFGGVAGAVTLLLREIGERETALRVEQRWFEAALAELPYLGAALNRDGRPEAVFGTAPAGLDPDRLALGLTEAAEPGDRPALYAALCEALDHGAGDAVFSPLGAPDRMLQLALRRRGEDGLSAVIHDITDASARAAARTAEIERLEGDLAARGPDGASGAGGSDDERLLAAERRAEEAEAQAAAKSRFLANMSHELRTPLNAIMGFSDIMRARMFGELSPKYGEYAELIHESGRHLTDLINDVLDMSKIEAARYTLTLESFDARDAINASMRLMRLQADEAGIQLRGLMPNEPLAVEADRRAIKQIVLNLVSNALKFTPRGGSVTVTARARGPELEMVVADTGAGIASEDLERLGRPYEQAGDAEHRAQGTGLGLSLVKAFADLHGGFMAIESAPGEGAAVTVRMPVIKAAAEPAPEPDPQPAPDIDEVSAELEPPSDLVTRDVEAAASEPEAPVEPEPAEEPVEEPAPAYQERGTVIHLPGPRHA